MFRRFLRPDVIPGDSGDRPVEILFLTCNRLYFTRMTLPALLDSSAQSFSVTVVDNASTDETVEYLRELRHPNLKMVILNRRNLGLLTPTRRFWKNSTADFVGKIDNDILVPFGWIEKLVEAHQRIPMLGFAAYCHFRTDDADDESVRPGVESIAGINIRLQPWIGGNYLAKKTMVLHNKAYRHRYRGFRRKVLHGFTEYQITLGTQGFMHGYLCDENRNLIRWEHLDDPRGSHYRYNPRHAALRGLLPEQIVEAYRRDGHRLLIEYRHPPDSTTTLSTRHSTVKQ